MSGNRSERLHALDATRGFALLLGIIFHATMSFLPAPHGAPVWIVMDSQRSFALTLVFYVTHIFRMTTFFVLAGFFAHMSFHKKGLRGFVRDRLKRIGIPFVVGLPILFALIVAATIWGAVVMAHGAPLPKPPPYSGFPAFPLTHLWFLYVLLLLYSVTLALRGAVVMVDRAGLFRTTLDRAVRALVRSPFGLVLLAAPTAAVLCLMPEWRGWFGIPTPDYSLVPNAAAAIGFGTAFLFGWLLHRQPELLDIWKRRWLLNLTLALAFTTFALSLIGLTPVLVPAKHDWQKALYAGCYALAIWSWTFAVIGMALRFLSRHSAVRRYVADASYWLYLIHVPLIMALQVAVSQLGWPWWVKFPLILGVAFPLMFASYQWFVRYSFIGAVLNGRRTRPRARDIVPALAEESVP